MKINFLKSALLLAFIASYGLASSQEAVLAYNLTKGKAYLQNTKLSNTIVQTMGGNEVKMFMDIALNADIVVEDVAANGDVTVIETLKNISVHNKAMGMDTTITFENVGERSRVLYSKEGKLIQRTILDSASVPGMSETSKHNWMYLMLPGKAVKTGEIWSNASEEKTTKSASNPFETITKSDFKYTYAGVEPKDGKDCQRIQFEANLSVEGKGEQMGMEMFIEGTGKNKGFGYFDPKSSIVSYIEFETGLDLTVSVAGQQNMSIPMTQSMKTIITLEEKI